MFGLDNLFAQTSAQKFYISRDRIAEILRVSPDALDAFEKAYSKAALQTEPESIFEVNSRQEKRAARRRQPGRAESSYGTHREGAYLADADLHL